MRLASLLALALSLTCPLYAQLAFRAVVLDAPGGLGTDARAVNDAGLAVVWVRDHDDGFWSAFWDSGLTRLLPLPGHNETYAEAVSNAGLAVGLSKPWLWEEATASVWVYPDGDPTPLPPGPPGGSYARDIGGQWVAGYMIGADFISTPVVWDLVGESCVTLSLYRDGVASGQAFGVNQVGQIVGWATGAGGIARATLWANYLAEPKDLATGAQRDARAFAINGEGVVVGGRDDQPFLWDGQCHELPIGHNEVGAAGAINDAGWAVGWVYSYEDGAYHAMLWRSGIGYRLEDCPGVGMPLAIARDINNGGAIACTGYDGAGTLCAVLLEPIETIPGGVVIPTP